MTMGEIKLYRRRYIPDEFVYLKNDEIISMDKDRIVTKWRVLKPRTDFTHGYSCYFINEGFKVSKFIDGDEKLVYWYCDIIDTQIDGNTYVFNDLLIDIIVYENGFVKVVDLYETAIALREKILDKEMIARAMERADRLLKIIYSNKFDKYTKYINEVL